MSKKSFLDEMGDIFMQVITRTPSTPPQNTHRPPVQDTPPPNQEK